MSYSDAKHHRVHRVKLEDRLEDRNEAQKIRGAVPFTAKGLVQ